MIFSTVVRVLDCQSRGAGTLKVMTIVFLFCPYSGFGGTSLLRSPPGLGASELNDKVTIIQGLVVLFALWNIIWDCAKVTLIVR